MIGAVWLDCPDLLGITTGDVFECSRSRYFPADLRRLQSVDGTSLGEVFVERPVAPGQAGGRVDAEQWRFVAGGPDGQ